MLNAEIHDSRLPTSHQTDMAYSPQDVYARHLVSRRGYPLWTPEPNMNLPDVYIREGLKIGDVGVVVPDDGSFDVFFNVCLPDTHALHRETGVPDNFTPILLNGRDIAKFPRAECAGRVISTSSVARGRGTDAYGDDPGPERYEIVSPRGISCELVVLTFDEDGGNRVP